ncbi:hypothetical protein [Paenibacillus whitsoniae]|nr:hypothetical protein [Paenibacillus whitsoniae]
MTNRKVMGVEHRRVTEGWTRDIFESASKKWAGRISFDEDI